VAGCRISASDMIVVQLMAARQQQQPQHQQQHGGAVPPPLLPVNLLPPNLFPTMPSATANSNSFSYAPVKPIGVCNVVGAHTYVQPHAMLRTDCCRPRSLVQCRHLLSRRPSRSSLGCGQIQTSSLA